VDGFSCLWARPESSAPRVDAGGSPPHNGVPEADKALRALVPWKELFGTDGFRKRALLLREKIINGHADGLLGDARRGPETAA